VIPLLVESGDARGRFDRILVVDCSEATQVARVSQRPAIDAKVARAILAAQATRARRLEAADDVLFNEGAGSTRSTPGSTGSIGAYLQLAAASSSAGL